MHLFFFLRGKFEQVELWKAHAQASYWKFRRKNLKTGKEETILIQGALRPSILGAYEFIFPKEALTEVCSFFGIVRNVNCGYTKARSTPFKILINSKAFGLRRIFGCKKIPKKILEKAKEMPDTFSTEEFERGCSNCKIPGVGVQVIGIKEDRMAEVGGKYYQEGL